MINTVAVVHPACGLVARFRLVCKLSSSHLVGSLLDLGRVKHISVYGCAIPADFLSTQIAELERARQAGIAGSYWVPSAVQQHFSRVVTQGSAVDAAARLRSLRQEVLLSRQSLVALQRLVPARLQRLEQAERDLRALQGV
ncbi:hypothetical protein Vafri_1781 [Volvox africanus]|nr:hypothetical protein Vafri_1781 [Volvox africanus]